MTAALTHRAAWLRSAVLGLLAWLIGLFTVAPDWAPALLLFGALVVVPLGLALLDDLGDWRQRVPSLATLPWVHLLCAVVLLASFALYPGHRAGLLALPWLGFTGVVALLGAARLVAHGYRSAAGIATSAAMIFLAVGGGWTLASRWGMEPMGFREPIVLLTGAHFHFAGFALPILAGLAARTLRTAAGRLAVAGVVLGVPLVAVGITAGRSVPVVELSAAWFLVAACLIVVGLQGALSGAGDGVGRANPLRRVRPGPPGRHGAGRRVRAQHLPGRLLADHPADDPLARDAQRIGVRPAGAAGLARRPAARDRASGRGVGPGGDASAGWVGETTVLAGGGGRAAAGRPPGRLRARSGNRGSRPPEPDGAHRRAAAAILRYDIFPPHLVRPLLRRAPIQVGDTVGICYRLAPGVELFFAARVLACFDEEKGGVWRTGFTYRTLVGHPEYGEETFSAEKDLATGRVVVALRSWSRPGTVLALLLPPWVRRQQVRAGAAALAHLAGVARP